MKKTIIAALLMLSVCVYSQEYQVKSIQSGGMTVKYDAVLKITDSLFSVSKLVDGENIITSYDIVNKRNNITYVTDGVLTHYFTILKKKGKKKGKSFTHQLLFTTNQMQGNTIIVYYLEQQ